MAYFPKTLFDFLKLLKTHNIKARLVGGCVRDFLLNLPTTDFDIAVAVPVLKLKEFLKKEKIFTYDLGLDFGSLGVLYKGAKIEATSLRKDSYFESRHPVVVFTRSFIKDSKRRDFTFNALYMDEEGKIFDPSKKGLKDLKEGRVRFIGNPQNRIEEDPLRILRFFRFYAFYGRVKPDLNTLKHLQAQKETLSALSKERIHQEILKLLNAPDPYEALLLMKETKVFEFFFKGTLPQKEMFLKLSPLLRFYCLLNGNLQNLETSWRFCKKDKKKLRFFNKIQYDYQQYGLIYSLYYHEKEAVLEMSALLEKDPLTMLQTIRSWQKPAPPFCVEDFLKVLPNSGFAYKAFKEKEKAWVLTLKKDG